MRTLNYVTCLLIGILAAQFAAAATLTHKISYYPEDFYARLDQGLEGADLKAALFEILSKSHVAHPGQNDTLVNSCGGNGDCYKHTSLGYTGARRILFGQLHLIDTGSGYAIKDVYCEQLVTKKDFHYNPPGPGKIPDPSVLNAEHTWPQSRFSHQFDKDLQKSDLHILYPVLSNANSSRSNDEFGEVVSPLSSPCKKSMRGYTAHGGNKVYFEVPEAHKGNVARAIFYFSTRYKLKVDINEEDSLRAWNRMDPPDADEIARNQAIFEKQKDRNPFIDHPELADLISDF